MVKNHYRWKIYRLRNLIGRGTICDIKKCKNIFLFIVIISSSTFFGAQQEKIIITGRVTDENSLPLFGATVLD